jgi:dTDP-4-dehydrorhamnose reductase
VKILLVGAEGKLGRCLLTACQRHQVYPLDRQALDITVFARVREAVACHHPDLLLNAAAFNDVDGAESRAEEAYAVNALGPRNLALAAAARGIPLLHVSTDYVFDGRSPVPYHEFDRSNPLSVYGASKLAGENAICELNPKHYIVRTAWLFWETGKNFLLSMSSRTGLPQLRVANDQFGSPTYVPHLAAAISRLIETDAYGTYHLAGKGGTSRFELVDTLFRRRGIGIPPVPVSLLEFALPARRPDYSVLRSIQDPRIELPHWQEGLDEFVFRLGRLDARGCGGP